MIVTLALDILLATAQAAPSPGIPQVLARVVAEHGMKGVVVLRTPDGKVFESDPKRADALFLPASTFKIPNSLIALEEKAVKDEKDVLKWDGVDRGRPAWNADTDMRAAIRNSTVWFYQEMARRIGPEKMRSWLDRFDYGNHDAGPVIDTFWLEGDLRISPRQQVEFLERLRRGLLPVSARTLAIVKDIMIVDRGPDWVLRAKTGWAARVKPNTGWYVGWLEREDGRVWTFAVNVDLEKDDQAKEREGIARGALKSVGAMP